MRNILLSWWMIAVYVALFLFILLAFVRIPIYDGVFFYDHDLVHFTNESKVALSYFFGNGLEKEMKNGILPSHFELKPIGVALLVVIHFGLPILVGLRVKFGRAKKSIHE